MSCEWEKVRGTGHDAPPVYRCETSRSEDQRDACSCCVVCECACERELDDDDDDES